MSAHVEARGGRNKDAFMVRMPDGLRERMKALAAQNGRSLNAEIVHRLLESLGDLEAPVSDDDEWVQFKLRMPSALHADLEELANREARSMGAQIVHILEQALLRGKA